ncbi:MAG: glycosyl hydrolase family 8 [Nitrospinota bacterium]|nr:glycosyl hydrolase family 8 [Nitrospinota bacterium]
MANTRRCGPHPGLWIPVAVGAIILAWGLGGAREAWGKEVALWERYKKTFITGDGRVVDYPQGEVSHSEGQGYSMLLALEHEDRGTFDKLWNWTRQNLAVRADGLLAWRWGKRITGAWGVIDYNNATDGDLLVATALVKAGGKWNNTDYSTHGLALARAIRQNLVIQWNHKTYLLPGHFGFEFNGGFTLNPSYMVHSAFRLLAQADKEGAATWRNIEKDAHHLVEKSGFGQMGLPADWVAVNGNGEIRLHWENSPYSGKEAIRVFLYSAFDGSIKSAPGLDSILGFYGKFGYIPMQVNLVSSEVALGRAPAGFYAVFAKAATLAGKGETGKKLFKEARAALDKEDKNYYSQVLYLLAISEGVL